jgi:uncharacterized protein
LSDQLFNLFGGIEAYIPWVSFVAGVGGSLHCVGMCGGLVTATCEKSHDIFRYQAGRLIGYLLLGGFAGLLGSFLNFKTLPGYFSLIPALMIGLLFIYWGTQNLQGKKAEIPTPKFMRQLYSKLWMRLVKKNQNFTKAFFTGFISIMLPCGLLYGVVLGTVALQHTTTALLSMFFFWLGTVPSMVVAPEIIQRFLKPLKSKLPKTYAISLVTIGVMTITFRMVKFHEFKNQSIPTQVENQIDCH